MARSLIALGSNLGDRHGQLRRALLALGNWAGGRLLARSRTYETPPLGGPAGQGPFANAAALLETALPPDELLHHLQHVERQLGRASAARWGARTIDLDLLLYEREGDAAAATGPNSSIDSPGAGVPRSPRGGIAGDALPLRLPHPRMVYRRFVLEPAAEITPGMVHAESGWTVARLLEQLDRGAEAIAIAGADRRAAVNLMEALAARFDLPTARAASARGGPACGLWSDEQDCERGRRADGRPKLLVALCNSASIDLSRMRTMLNLPPRGPVAWIGGDPDLTPLDEASAAIESIWPHLRRQIPEHT